MFVSGEFLWVLPSSPSGSRLNISLIRWPVPVIESSLTGVCCFPELKTGEQIKLDRRISRNIFGNCTDNKWNERSIDFYFDSTAYDIVGSEKLFCFFSCDHQILQLFQCIF